jgi:hypothetical protein
MNFFIAGFVVEIAGNTTLETDIRLMRRDLKEEIQWAQL